MADVWVGCQGIGGKRERFKCGMEVGNTILSEESDEVESSDGKFSRRWWEDGAKIGIYYERLGKGQV